MPALDEEQALPLVLADLFRLAPPACLHRVLVIDNGSTDATARIAVAAGAEVVSEPRRGYGAACLAGLAALRADPPQVVVFLDADHSDDVAVLPRLAGPVLDGRADLVLGSRLLGRREAGAMAAHALWGNRLACLLLRRLTGVGYTDLGPFRAIGWDALQRLGMADRDFGWTVEMQLKAARSGLRIEEIPVPYRRRVGRSKISGTVTGSVRAGVKILRTLWRHRVRHVPSS